MSMQNQLDLSDTVTESFGSACCYTRGVRIDSGQFGVIYKARITDRRDFTGGNVAAVKIVFVDKKVSGNSEKRAMLLQKLQMLLNLKHPHLVEYYKLSVISQADVLSEYELLMDYYSDGDLERLLEHQQKEHAPLQKEDVVCYAMQLADGLGFLHGKKIIHGDLKPGNVLVQSTKKGHHILLIGDFDDSVRMRKNVTTARDVTSLRGSYRYMSPEMLRKYYIFVTEETIGRKTDVWSLGCVVLDLFNAGDQKHFLYNESSDQKLEAGHAKTPATHYADKIVKGFVPYVPDPVSALTDSIRQCLCKDSANRISAASFLNLIRNMPVVKDDTESDSAWNFCGNCGVSVIQGPYLSHDKVESLVSISSAEPQEQAKSQDQGSCSSITDWNSKGSSERSSGERRPVELQVFPWEKASGTPSRNGNSHVTSNTKAQYGDVHDPVKWLANLTLWLTLPSCATFRVPEELRSILSEEIISKKSLHTSKKSLQRIRDLNVISDGFHEELKDIQTNQTDTLSLAQTLRQTFWHYLVRKDMTAVLNFTKVLYEDHKYESVGRIVEYLKKRKIFEGPSKSVYFACENIGFAHGETFRLFAWRQPPADDSWVAQGSDVQVRPGKYQGGSRVYQMSSNPRGHVLIINNEEFAKGTKYSERLGTHVDGANLSRLFQGLSFDIYRGTQFRNLTRRDMRTLVREFSLYEDHQNVHASVVCILSHGEEDGIVGTDGERLTEIEIKKYFIVENCPNLANKPKIFIFVACRGSSIDTGKTVEVPEFRTELTDVQISSDGPTNIEDTTGNDFRISSEVEIGMLSTMRRSTHGLKIPNHADFITIYATVPGYRSLRDIDKGTWFVQDFVEVVAKEGYLYDLTTMICEVNNRLSERATKDGEKQTLIVSTTLRKNLFFNPGF